MAVYLHSFHIEWFDSLLSWIEEAFKIQIAQSANMAYFLSKLAGSSALWMLIVAFYVQPMYVYLRFDLREFKKMVGGFAVAYALLHTILLVMAHDYAFGYLGKQMMHHLFLGVGMAALVLLSIAPLIKAWYKLLYIAVVLVMMHVMLGYNTLNHEHVLGLSLLALGLALRLVKR